MSNESVPQSKGGTIVHLLWAMILVFSMLPAFGQRVNPSLTPNSRISGTVVQSVSGQPLAGIEVSISPTEKRELSVDVITEADGRFVFTDVAPGKYSLVAKGRGFSSQAYQQHGQYSTAVAVGANRVSEDLTFALVPDASISGVVVDQDNEPVRPGEVSLYERGAGKKTSLWSREALDDAGHYHFGHLPPGSYLIAVVAQPWYGQDPSSAPTRNADGNSDLDPKEGATQSDESALDVTFRTTYYADATEPEGAATIQLHAGERFTADMMLQAVPSLHLTIRKATSRPDQPATAIVQHRIFDGPTSVVPARVQPLASGVVRVGGIAAGHYLINLRQFTGKDWKSSNREVDLVADTDIDASENTAGSVSIRGDVRLPGNTPIPPGAHVQLLNRSTGENFVAQISPKGEFQVQQSLSSSSFEVAVLNIPDAGIRSMSATGAKVTGRKVLLPRGGTVQLTINLQQGFARVDGTVLCEDKPRSQAMVLLVPSDTEVNADLFRRDQSDSDGTFSLYQVLPGRYTVVAIENGWDLDWQDPTVLKPFLEHGQVIDVTAARTYKLSLEAQNPSAPTMHPALP